MGSDDWPDWLPGDWTMQIRKVDERKVKCYVDPEGHKCYSKPQVIDYLRSTKRSIPNEKTQNADDSAIDLSVDPNAPNTEEVPESTPGGDATKLTPRSSRRKIIPRDLSEDVLAGDDSPSVPSSRGRKGEDSSWLPEGWTVEVKTRQVGSSTGMKYKVYTNPSGNKFASKPQVLSYLAKTNSSAGGQGSVLPEPISATPISAWQEKPTAEGDNSEIYEATEAESKTPKKASARLSSAHEVMSRTPAEGLPPGWIKELRLRKRGLHKYDPFYVHPSVGYAFFSKKDVSRYLESGDVTSCAIKPLKRDINSDDTLDVNLTSPPDQSKGTEASKDLTNGSVEELKTDDGGTQNSKPTRSISGGAFTPQSKEETSDWLPEGWAVEVRYKSSGAKFKIYKDPAGKQFYSKPQVLSYLGIASSSNSKKRKENKSSDVAHDTSANSTPGDASRPKRSGRKKAKIEDTDFQEVITTSAAEGLPPGWIKEIRTKIYATHKRNDPFYTDPVTGYIFRSKLDAMRFLETGDVNLCAIRPKVKDKDGNEVFVVTDDVKKPATGKGDEENDPSDPKTAEKGNRRVSTRVTKNSSPPGRASTRQKGKSVAGDSTGEKQETGVNLEKQPDDEGNLTFEIPDDDNWTDHCIDFAVKTLTNEIMFNGQPAAASGGGGGGAGFPEENVGVKETTPTKVN